MKPPKSPLTYRQAVKLGADLRRAWPLLTTQKRGPKLTEEQFGDVVQFVLRKAQAVIEEKQGGRE